MSNHFIHNIPRNVIIIFLALNAIFIFTIPLLPFIDLPNHLAEATIFKYYSMPGNSLARFYEPVPWYFPNVFHTVFCSLFPTVEIGNKVFHIVYMILLQASLYLVIKQLKGNAWYGLLGILFTYSYNLTFGFVGFAISIPVIIILFYITLLDFREEKLLYKIVISILLVLLYLMHAQNALFGLLLYGLMMLYKHGISSKKLWTTSILVSLPLITLIFTWWFLRPSQNEPSTFVYLAEYYTSLYFTDLPNRLRIVAFDNFQLQESWVGVVIAVIFFISVLVPVVIFKPWKNKYSLWLADTTVYPFIFFAASLGCYLFLPHQLPGQSPLSQRFCTLAIFSFIILASVWLKDVKSTRLQYFTIAAAIVYSILWFEYLYTFNQENKNFNSAFFQGIDNKSRMGGLIYKNAFRGRRVYIHYPNYFLIWNTGIVTSKIIDYRFGVIKRLASETDIPFYQEYIGDTYTLANNSHLEYILTRAEAPVKPDNNLKNFTLFREAYPWRIFQKIPQ